MAVGVIASPPTWLLRTVAMPAWFQSVQDNVNYAFGTKYLWLSPADMCIDSAGWSIGGGGVYWQASGAGQNLFAPLPLLYTSSGTYATGKRLKPSLYEMRCLSAGGGVPLKLTEFHIKDLSTTTAPTGVTGGNASVSGAVQQTVTVTPDGTIWQNNDQAPVLKMVSGASGDRVYAIRVTYALNG